MGDNSIDLYLKESCKSFEACRVKNSARRNSLQKKTTGIETARKKVTSDLDREEKLIRRQLADMQSEKPDKKKSQRESGLPTINEKGIRKISKTLSVETSGKAYSARRGRRISKEFEDLHMITTTGKLLPQSSMVAPSRFYRQGRVGSSTNLMSVDTRTPQSPRKTDNSARFRKISQP
ncbi:hypothetical protein SNE40_019488 [Patella caerulea]|uniref:Uncharacterized protein n=1 Tax=Patella caerulea TaxID=87958 RepID=A0AAN8J7A3_PATCE